MLEKRVRNHQGLFDLLQRSGLAELWGPTCVLHLTFMSFISCPQQMNPNLNE